MLTLLVALLSMLLPFEEERQESRYRWSDFEEEFLCDEERAEDEDVMAQLEMLRELNAHPLNINTADEEDLRQLPFLTDTQIEQIHAYIYLHGQMQTLAELRLVPFLDEATRRRLSLFVYAKEEQAERSVGQRLRGHLRQDFTARLDVPLYYRLGQQTPHVGYRGNPLYSRIRYTVGNRMVEAGLRTEKDAGERFGDSHGGYAMVQEAGIVHRIVVGDYRIGLGEGLVLGGSAWNSKSAPPLKMQAGIRPMKSTDEVNFLRGAAATLAIFKQWTVTLFGSWRKRDATLTDRGTIQTLLSSGYHRTPSECERKGNASDAVAGAGVQWQRHGFHAGATGYWQSFNRILEPGQQLYRAIYPKGKNFGAGGLNYGYTRYRLSLAGETAYSNTGGIAALHRASWTFNRRYTLSALQRFYAYQYHSFYANALAENANVQNESGLLLHLRAEPVDGLRVVAYADFFHNPWPRYGMTQSSTGQECSLQGEYVFSSRSTLLARYQTKRKARSDMMELHHRLKLQWTFTPGQGAWRWQTAAALHSVAGSTGVSVAQRLNGHFSRPGISLSCMLGYFRTDDYQSRVYVTLPALYNSISSALLFGHGMHGTLTCRWQSKRAGLMLEGRYGMLRYFDRRQQGSGLQTILSPWKHDVSLQLRCRI